jgi:hypothetical protein
MRSYVASFPNLTFLDVNPCTGVYSIAFTEVPVIEKLGTVLEIDLVKGETWDKNCDVRYLNLV